MRDWLCNLIKNETRDEVLSVCNLIFDWCEEESSRFRSFHSKNFVDPVLEVILEMSQQFKDASLCNKSLGAIWDGFPEPQTKKAIDCFGFYKLQQG
jgi:hypothetical protein